MLAIATQWVGLIGVIGGILATGLMGLLTAVITHRLQRLAKRDDKDVELREARAALLKDATTRLVTAVDALELSMLTSPPTDGPRETLQDAVLALGVLREQNRADFDKMQEAEAEIEIVAGKAARGAASQMTAALGEVAAQVLTLPEPANADIAKLNRLRTKLLAAIRTEHSALLS
jgi:hypothetical protein